MSLRAAAIRSLPAQYRHQALRPVLPFLRSYASSSNSPRPSRNAPTPAGLEGLFGGGGGSSASRRGIATPKPPGSEGLSGPSAPKTPDVQLPEGQTGPEAEQLGNDREGESPEEKVEKRNEKVKQKLGEGSKGNRLAGGGGGGGGGGSGGSGKGGAGGPGGAGNGGPGGMSQNQLILAAVA